MEKKENGMKTWCVYCISDGPHMKIGLTGNLGERLSALQASNPRPLKVVAVLEFSGRKQARLKERQLHWLFRHNHVRGEWFRMGVTEIVAALCEELDGYLDYEDLTRFKLGEESTYDPQSKPETEDKSSDEEEYEF